MKFVKREIEDQGIDMIPLVDTIIHLIIYFAIATSFAFISGMKVSLPKAGVSEFAISQQKKIVISIKKDGTIFLDNQQMHMNQLESRLREMKKNRPDQTVVIQADKETYHGIVVSVLDLARSIGFEKMAIATEPKSEAEKLGQ